MASFDGTNGAIPEYSSPVQGTNGNLYGTTNEGGGNNAGTIYQITPAGTLTTLYNFCTQSNCSDGSSPYAGLVLATNGEFYGTTGYGAGAGGLGTVFKITAAGELTTLHTFEGTDGLEPTGLVQATNRDLYGTTIGGGAYGLGTVFQITTLGKLTTLHSFGGTDGEKPYGTLVQATNGNFYGTTVYGGSNNDGAVFEITTSGQFTTLYSFCTLADCADGQYPTAGLVQATNGDLYGTTGSGGTAADGTVFKITTAGKLTTLHSFGGTDGEMPYGTLVQATNGNFYGTTVDGGSNNDGTVFEINTAGKLTTLYNFCTQPECADGAFPSALVQATNGNFFGTTELKGANSDGTIFSLSVGLGAFVETNPTSGKVGSEVTILGNNLKGATNVSFNGMPATFKASSTHITTTVPNGATTGTVTVTTASNGTLNGSVRFVVLIAPQITSFTPTSGPVGTSVQITGVGLANTDVVTFGGAVATSFTINSDTQVTATVPTGAKTGKIGITTPGGTAKSASSFTVTR